MSDKTKASDAPALAAPVEGVDAEDIASSRIVAATARALEETSAGLNKLLDSEQSLIHARREKAFPPDAPDLARTQAGLALSGGGVRSATFCLGLIQGLAANGLLRRFDYLSTVSGGGYIGASVGRLINRWGIDRAESMLASGDSQILSWLRKNGRYLTPSGARDLGMAIATLMRSSISTHFELGIAAMLFAFFVVFPHALQGQFNVFDATVWSRWKSAWWPIALATWLLGAPGSIWSFWTLRDPLKTADDSDRNRERGWNTLIALVVLCVSVWFAIRGFEPGHGWIPEIGISFVASMAALSALSGMVFVIGKFWRLRAAEQSRSNAGIGTDAQHAANVESMVNGLRNTLTRWLRAVNTIASGMFVLGLLDWLSFALAYKLHNTSLFAWLPGIAGVIGVIVLALRNTSESLQKKVASSGSDRMIGLSQLVDIAGLCAGGILLFSWIVFLHCLVLFDDPINILFHGIAPVWSLLAIVALILIWLGLTSKHKEAVNNSTLHGFYRARLIRAYLSVGNDRRFPNMPKRVRGDIEANTKSVVDVVDGDDIDLATYQPHVVGGPIHLVNVTLNQTVDDHGDLYNADRKGSAVTVSATGVEVGPSEAKAWAPSDNSASLGQWITISGAAASPGAGSNTTRGWALLLYIFGVRLGYWTPSLLQTTDAKQSASLWARGKATLQATKTGLMVSEAIGDFAGRQFRWWYLSDGGHFENTGVYALLKRELPFIVLADCGADPQYLMEDIENLVRKARIDFDAEIELYTEEEANNQFGPFDSELRVLSPEKVIVNNTPRGILLARICYHSSDPTKRTFGTLVIVKPNLHASLDTDVLAYARRNPSFPQQSTADQFFDESQWESYRRLGQDFGNALTADRLSRLPGWQLPVPTLDQVVPLRPQLQSPPEKETIAEPFWKRRAGAAAIGTTLSLGVVTSVLGVGWSIYDGLMKERQDQQTQVSTTIAKTLKDFDALSPRLCEVGLPQKLDFCTESAGSLTDLSKIEKDALTQMYQRTGNPDYKTSLEGLSESLAQIRQACGMASATCSDPLPKPVNMCGAVCDAPIKQVDFTPYWALSRKPSAPEENVIVGPLLAEVRSFATHGDAPTSNPTTPVTSTNASPPAGGNAVKPDLANAPDLQIAKDVSASATAMSSQAADLSLCRMNPAPISLYIQIFDSPSVVVSDAIKKAFDGSPNVRLAQVENVTKTAHDRGTQVPTPWKRTTLLVHLPSDRACAEEVAKKIQESSPGGKDLPVEVRNLPASFKSTRHVLELWLPPSMGPSA